MQWEERVWCEEEGCRGRGECDVRRKGTVRGECGVSRKNAVGGESVV